MKKLILALLAVCSCGAFAGQTMMTDSNGVVLFPTNATFNKVTATNLATKVELSSVSNVITTHIGLLGTNVHGLGLMALESTTGFTSKVAFDTFTNYVQTLTQYVPTNTLADSAYLSRTNFDTAGSATAVSNWAVTAFATTGALTTATQYSPTNTLASTAYMSPTNFTMATQLVNGVTEPVSDGLTYFRTYGAWTNRMVINTNGNEGKVILHSKGNGKNDIELFAYRNESAVERIVGGLRTILEPGDVAQPADAFESSLEVSDGSNTNFLSVAWGYGGAISAWIGTRNASRYELATKDWVGSLGIATNYSLYTNLNGNAYSITNVSDVKTTNGTSLAGLAATLALATNVFIDAPSDGTNYGRMDGAWSPISDIEGTNSLKLDGTSTMNGSLNMDAQSILFNGNVLSFDTNDYALAFNATNFPEATLQIGQESYVLARNESGRDVTNGEAVYINGASGSRVSFKLAATTNAGVDHIIGLATHDIANNNNGFITMYGLVRYINTDNLTEGELAYLGNIAGQLSSTAGVDSVVVGTVSRKHATEGSVFVSSRHSPYHDSNAVSAVTSAGFLTNETDSIALAALTNGLSSTDARVKTVVAPENGIAVFRSDAGYGMGFTIGSGNPIFYDSSTNICQIFAHIAATSIISPTWVNTNDTRYLAALTNELDLVAGSSISNHLTNATAHSTLFAGKVATNDTKYLDTITNIIVNAVTGTVASGVASVTIPTSGSGITNLTASTNSAGVVGKVDAYNWTIGTNIDAVAGVVLTNGSTAMTYLDMVAPATAPSAPASGFSRLYSQTVNGQSSFYLQQSDGGTFRIGRDLVNTVFADASGGTLTNGVGVHWTTNMTTTAHHATLALASDSSKMPCNGIIVMGNITNGGSGTMMWQGRTPTGYLSSALSALPYGTPLYVSSTEAGGFQATPPASPNYVQMVGYVGYNGALDVRIGSSAPAAETAVERQWNLWPASNSTVAAGAKAMRLQNEAVPAGTWTNSTITNTQYFTFCSLPIGVTQLKAGFYTLTVNMKLESTTAPTKALDLSGEVYIRATNGVETELTAVSGTPAQALTAVPLEYIYRLSIPSNVTVNTSDSIEVKLKASGVVGSPVLIINSGTFSVPIPSGQFVTLSDAGATNMVVTACPAITNVTYSSTTRAFTLQGPAAGSTDTNTVKSLILESWRNPVALNNSPTTTLVLANGSLVSLLCTNTTYFDISTNDWSMANVGYVRLCLNLNGSTYSWNTNAVSGTTALSLTSTGAYDTVILTKPLGTLIWRARQ